MNFSFADKSALLLLSNEPCQDIKSTDHANNAPLLELILYVSTDYTVAVRRKFPSIPCAGFSPAGS